MDDQAEVTGMHGSCCGEETEGGRGQSAGEEGECCGGHGQRHGHGGGDGQGCGCESGATGGDNSTPGNAGRHGHGKGQGGGGCCGGHGEHGEHGGHGHHGDRRMPTPAEHVAMLEHYLKELKAETLAVEERLTQLKAAA